MSTVSLFQLRQRQRSLSRRGDNSGPGHFRFPSLLAMLVFRHCRRNRRETVKWFFVYVNLEFSWCLQTQLNDIKEH